MVIPIDSDLQDPPEMIPAMIKKAEEGFDVVYAVRTKRQGESWLKTFTSSAFYKVLRQMTDTPIPANTGDFRLMRQPVVEAIKQMRETHRFMRGMFSWVGFKQAGLPYVRETRFAGKTKWNYWKLWNFAIEGITSFSHIPLKVATYLGLLAASFAFVAGIFYAVKAILWGDPVPGFPTLITAILFMGGIQLITLGVIGEYVGRIYGESKGRRFISWRAATTGASGLMTAPEPASARGFLEATEIITHEAFGRHSGL
jgi:glycosyltransferase involved in cell wall biosynthesis